MCNVKIAAVFPAGSIFSFDGSLSVKGQTCAVIPDLVNLCCQENTAEPTAA